MFNFITWELFLTIITVLIGTYYIITSLAFYHAEIRSWLKSFSQPKQVSLTSREEQSGEDLMGTTVIAHEDHVLRSSFIPTGELITSGNDEEPEQVHAIKPKDELLIGSVADLLEEVKTLIQLIAEYRTGKTESKALFDALFIRYPHLQHTTYPLAISFYIHEAAKGKFSYDITADEIMSWWPSTIIISN